MSLEENDRKGYCLLLSRVNTSGFSDSIVISDPITNKIIINNTINSSNNYNSNNTTNNNTNTNTPLVTNRKNINNNNTSNDNNNNTNNSKITETVTYEYDICFDKIITNNNNNNEIHKDLQELIIHKNYHINQNDIWNKIAITLHKKWEEKNKSVTVLAIGGHHSGKSYSLFGSTIDNEERGN